MFVRPGTQICLLKKMCYSCSRTLNLIMVSTELAWRLFNLTESDILYKLSDLIKCHKLTMEHTKYTAFILV